jgi:hypothetical protein
VTDTAQISRRRDSATPAKPGIGEARPRYRPLLTVAATTFIVLAFLFPAWNAEPFRDVVSRLVPYLPVALYAAVAAMLTLSVIRSWWPSVVPHAIDVLSARLDRLRFLAGPVALGGCVVAYLASLVENWESGSRRFFTIGGIVPWSDAQAYFVGAERVLFDGKLDAFNSVRPLNTVDLAIRLAVTGLDLRAALVIQAVMLGVASYLAARVVARDLGPLAGFALFTVIYGFAAFHVESTLTETLGVTLGCLAFAVLWQAVRQKNVVLVTGGIFLLAVGLVARAGTIAVLATLLAWFAWHLRGASRINWRVLALGVAAVVVAFATNYVVILSLKGDTRAPNSNFGYVMYGLATGYPGWDATQPSWTRAYSDFPVQMARRSLTERAQFAGDRAREEIRSDPVRFAKTVARSGLNYADLARDTSAGAVTNATMRRLLYAIAGLGAAIFLVARWRSSRWWALVDAALAGCAVYAIPVMVGAWPDSIHSPSWFPLALTGFMVATFVAAGASRLGSPALVSFTIAAFVGMIVSTPFLADGTSGVRVFAATIPFLALPFMFSVALLTRPQVQRAKDAYVNEGQRPHKRVPIPLAIGLALVAVIVIAGPLAAALVGKPEVRARSCPNGRPAKAFLGGESVQLVRDSADHDLDQFKIGRFDPQQLEIRGLLASVRPGMTLLSAIDDRGAPYIVVIDGRQSAPHSSTLYLCGSKVSDATTRASAETYGAPLNVFFGRPLNP